LPLLKLLLKKLLTEIRTQKSRSNLTRQNYFLQTARGAISFPGA